MRQAKILYDNVICGLLTETDDGEFTFKYEDAYVNHYPSQFITFTMPVRNKEYKEKRLFPFFEGLIPEGWLLDIASKNWKINTNDRMGLLLACCQNCIGAVSVQPIQMKDE
ncbi:phosphatidylinositol kinase [Subsaximicrobium wynnwilliamsii]|uniref:Phosphatidylinositol kinase n=1 Tax=Subsaximicrobium wynnwilliamsii TaxID=291179 RepID=A0A5C6ZNM6_9FLAO|nr:HipA N-terminal domain-containing protein [Subsaximicrobium wynnwilliamsii]TXD84932.1 phosphatidylinositol kinase [Subsaximicrobium wynnwilliamsii]TXD90603.1 phosphatidylinositol kinase [Subsaximicrobium wynnwilliamsii]TXE05077.1 phosphatidylinositol kinase [Subsaximicrobium wynnwilliamsii]